MKRRAFLVYGAESSGNRLMTRILCACGCYGDGQHHQRLNEAPPPPGVELIAWHRSVPYARAWPDLVHHIDIAAGAGYDPTAVVMTRDWHATARSQVNAPHVEDIEQGYQHIEQAYALIFDAIITRQLPYVMVAYECLSNPQYVRWLLGRLGLELQGELETITNQNGKYYGP